MHNFTRIYKSWGKTHKLEHYSCIHINSRELKMLTQALCVLYRSLLITGVIYNMPQICQLRILYMCLVELQKSEYRKAMEIASAQKTRNCLKNICSNILQASLSTFMLRLLTALLCINSNAFAFLYFILCCFNYLLGSLKYPRSHSTLRSRLSL